MALAGAACRDQTLRDRCNGSCAALGHGRPLLKFIAEVIHLRLVISAFFLIAGNNCVAGAQAEEKLTASVQTTLASAIADRSAQRLIGDPKEVQAWLAEMSSRLAKRMPDSEQRNEFLVTVQYEASRAGLDPQLVLAVINHESAFRKYAISSASARGFMQVMPFWVKLIGMPAHNLFHLRTNLRYGCVILRHYLDIEKGDVVRALARYNGSLGRFEYPNTVLGMQESRWKWSPGKPSG